MGNAIGRGTQQWPEGVLRLLRWQTLMGSIFKRMRLRPAQLRTVADRRFDDARYLCNSGLNARANGAIYLCGFVIECLLKAKLLEKFRWLQSTGAPERLQEREKRVWSLCYRSHDLAEILEHLPETARHLAMRQERLADSLRSLCAQWTIFARYSPHTADITEASLFVSRVKELKPWLR